MTEKGMLFLGEKDSFGNKVNLLFKQWSETRTNQVNHLVAT